MIEFKYNDEGILEVWKDGEKTGTVDTMGDNVPEEDDSVKRFRERRQKRLDAKADEEGRWVTTEEGHHVHFNENGEPDKGNPHVLNVMKFGTKTRAQLGKVKIGKTLKRIESAVSEYNKAWQESKILQNEWYEAESIYRSKRMETKIVASYQNTLKGWGLDGKSSDELRKETDKLKEQRSRLQEGKLTKDEANSFFRQWKNRRIDECKSELDAGTVSQDVYDKLVSNTNNTSLDTFMENWADSNLEFQINRYEMAAERKQDIENYKESEFKDAEKKRDEAVSRRDEARQRVERAEKAIASEISRRNIEKIRFLEDDEREAIINNAKSSSAFEKLNDEQKQSMIDSLKNASDAELSILDQTCGKVEMKEIPDGATSHYTEGRGVLYIETEDFSNPSVMWHEYGHFLDDGKCSGMDLYEERLNEWSRHGLSNDLYEHRVVHGKEAAEDMQELLDSKFPGKYDVKTDSAHEGYIVITDKETGELADSGLVMIQTMDISSEMFRKILYEPTEEYKKSVGFPEDVKYSDYFESYFTPKRHIYREKEKFNGARDAWREALIKHEEQMDGFLKDHPDFWDNIHKLDEERGINEKRIAPVSDILSAMLHGRFGTIYGSHDMLYYSQDRHTQNECVANYHQMRLMNDTFALNTLNQFAPRMTKRLKERYDLWLWKNIKVK